MRNISFALTTDQVRRREKRVTRRLGWARLKPGTLLQPIVKGQGIPKGGTVEKIGGPIRVVGVRREPLFLPGQYGKAEAGREGFPKMDFSAFARFFMAANACSPDQIVTRIEFEYVEEQS